MPLMLLAHLLSQSLTSVRCATFNADLKPHPLRPSMPTRIPLEISTPGCQGAAVGHPWWAQPLSFPRKQASTVISEMASARRCSSHLLWVWAVPFITFPLLCPEVPPGPITSPPFPRLLLVSRHMVNSRTLKALWEGFPQLFWVPAFPAATTFEHWQSNINETPAHNISLSTALLKCSQAGSGSSFESACIHTHTHTPWNLPPMACGQLCVRRQLTLDVRVCSLWRHSGRLPKRMASQFYKLFIRPVLESYINMAVGEAKQKL